MVGAGEWTMARYPELTAAALLLLCGSQASAEVRSATAMGFEVESKAIVPATPAQTYAMLGRIGEWWSGDHSYSGDAANMRLKLKAGGCFCERLPNGGGIEHLRVVYVEPGKRIVLTGALGPLLFDAVHGVMDVQIRPRLPAPILC